MTDYSDLIRRAREVAHPKKLSSLAESGSVGAAILTDKGNTYVGVCIDNTCGLGLCAEHTAIGAMVTAGESRIDTVVAVDYKGKILSPCGRCREMMYQINDNNALAKIILKNERLVTLQELLPEYWFENDKG